MRKNSTKKKDIFWEDDFYKEYNESIKKGVPTLHFLGKLRALYLTIAQTYQLSNNLRNYSEDIYQDTYYKIHKTLIKRKKYFKSPMALKTYIIIIIQNLIIDLATKLKGQPILVEKSFLKDLYYPQASIYSTIYYRDELQQFILLYKRRCRLVGNERKAAIYYLKCQLNREEVKLDKIITWFGIPENTAKLLIKKCELNYKVIVKFYKKDILLDYRDSSGI